MKPILCTMPTPEINLHKKGQIQLIFGPMFSGKTTELMRRLKRYQIASHKCLVIKYAKDIRYDDTCIATHDKQFLPAVSTMELEELREKALDFSVIGIDEGQFFPDTVNFAEDMANKGKIVIISALDGTYQRQGFGDLLNLVPLAESVIKLTAVCKLCFEEASYTKRTSSETAVEVIGGSEKYIAVCRSCYFIKTPQKVAKQPSSVSPLKENCSSNCTSLSSKRRIFDSKDEVENCSKKNKENNSVAEVTS